MENPKYKKKERKNRIHKFSRNLSSYASWASKKYVFVEEFRKIVEKIRISKFSSEFNSEKIPKIFNVNYQKWLLEFNFKNQMYSKNVLKYVHKR